jgi:hypothetical protein
MSQSRTRQLNAIQLKAAQGIASGLSQGEAAAAAGASRRSVVRWLSDPLFQKKVSEFSGEIHQAKVEIIRETTREFSLESLIPKALNVVGEILSDADERAANKLKACSLIGNWVGLRAAPSSDEDGNRGFPGDAYFNERGENQDLPDPKYDLSKLSDEELKALYFSSLGAD